jgi:hypothetical protein
MRKRFPEEEDEQVYQEEEVNVTHELDYDIPEPDYTIYEEEEQVISDGDEPSILSPDSIRLIRLGTRIKKKQDATNKFRSQKGEQARK